MLTCVLGEKETEFCHQLPDDFILDKLLSSVLEEG